MSPVDGIFASSPSLGNYKFLTLNVAGLRAAANKGLRDYLAKENADFVCISETKCEQAEIPFDCASLGYKHVYFNASTAKRGYAGTAIFSKFEAKSVTKGIGCESDEEGRAITLEFDKFYLVQTYVPNSGEGLKFEEERKAWDKQMRLHLNELAAQKPVIWTGDLNVAYRSIDVYDGPTNKARAKTPGFTSYERSNFSDLIQTDGWVDVWLSVRGGRDSLESPVHTTFWSRRAGMKAKDKGWRLDYFIVSPSVLPHVKSIEIRKEEDMSDHVPLILTLS